MHSANLFSLKLTGLHPTCLWGAMNTLVVFETPQKLGLKLGVTQCGQNLLFEIFHVFYKIRCNFAVFQATIKCLTILESSGHWLRSPLINLTQKCHLMSSNVQNVNPSQNRTIQLWSTFPKKARPVI